MSAKITMDEWQAEMSRLDATINVQPIPRGWFTTRDEANRKRVSYGAASKSLSNKWRLGFLERQQHPNPAGIGSPIFIYRVKKKK